MAHTCSKAHPTSGRYDRVSVAEIYRRPAIMIMPSHDEIAELAYAYWEERGRPYGSPLDDWFRAEKALRERKRLALSA